MEVRRPVTLVGHSLGGAIVEVYAKDYRGEVASLVLVDPEDGRLIALERAAMPGDLWAVHERRVMESIGTLSVAQRLELEALEASGELVRQSLPLPSVPSVLLTGTKKNPEFPGNPIEQDLKLQLHVELARTTPGMQHWLVPTSRHYIQNDAPDEVIQAIKRVLALAGKDAASNER
jgi:pimeloyl-ACP methyl ester carboxylesterase